MPADAVQYAPPLSSYSAEHCGLSVAHTEYNRALQKMAFTGLRDLPLVSPLVQKRLTQLRQIRSTGYDTLAPIGINKTMRDLDEEAQLDEEDMDSQGIQAENLVAASTTQVLQNGANVSSVSAADGPGLEAAPASIFLPETDLDAHVPDADASDLSPQEALSRSRSETPDGFMAEDVEYQFDHSLLHDSAAGQESLSDSHASFTTGSVLSGPIASHPTASTYATATSNLRACDESDVDMTLE